MNGAEARTESLFVFFHFEPDAAELDRSSSSSTQTRREAGPPLFVLRRDALLARKGPGSILIVASNTVLDRPAIQD